MKSQPTTKTSFSGNNDTARTAPRVSIGLPVYNGERFLPEALDSLLDQTFEDFELIISDNASTDRTEQICRAYATRDERVRYYRKETNIGAGGNFNSVFELSSGEYFKWAACDDVCEPSFIERCVEALDRDLDVVVAYTKVKIVDENTHVVELYGFDVNADRGRPHQRLKNQIRGHQCYEIFGVIRRSALAKTPLMGNYFAGDAVLLVRLGLLGKLREINEFLFLSRNHGEQSQVLKKDVQSYTAWFNPDAGGRVTFPYWRVLTEYVKSVHRSSFPVSERLCCYLHIAGWCGARIRHLMRDLLRAARQILMRFVRIGNRGNRSKSLGDYMDQAPSG